jgi:hypothetical protein
MAGSPSFEIPTNPERTYPFSGGVEYEGELFFELTPAEPRSESALIDLLESIFAAGAYRHGDFFNLPMPVYLVKDAETGDVFRVSVRDGAIRFHVLPSTDPPGLRRLYAKIVDRSDLEWHVARRSKL